jgi:DNA-directed RNA polymerase II subunit RPB2
MPCLIYVGMVYYQRLKHLVADKMHSCAHAARAAITRQPVEGRTNAGAFKVGGMERDCIAGVGASAFLRDRLLEQSDDYKVNVCSICGLIANVSLQEGTRECRVCRSNDVKPVRLPYGAKLLTQELMGMGIVGRMLTSKYKDES